MSADEALDAELLAMAGDDSDDEGEADVTQQIEEHSPTPEAAPVKSTVEKSADSGPKRGVAQKVRAKRGKKARRREQSEDEDAIASAASSPRSNGSGAMDHSDSEADAPASPSEDEAPLFPVDGLFKSSADRAHIVSLPEIERETILADRAAEVTRKQQDLQLKRALAATREKAKTHKRKAAVADLEDDSSKRSSRPKVEKTGRSALDDYKRAREQRGADKTRVDTRRDRREDRSPSSASDRDADGEDEVEWAAEPSSDAKRDEPPADLRDFNRCHVGRSNFAKVCFYPNFESAVKGCFARVSIGPDRATGQGQYRMTQIKGFVEGKPYKLEAANGKTFTTDQYALVAHGSAEKPWPFLACSDSKFTDAEFDRYVATLQKENMRMPNRKFINNKLDDIHALLNHNWTEEDIQSKINKQRAMAKKHDPANALNLQREKINKRRAIAQENDDAEEVAKCDAELASLENQRLNPPTISVTAKGGPVQPERKREQDRLAELNHQTRRTNAEEVRKALVEEKRKLQRARERAIAEAKAKRAEEEAKKNGSLAIPSDLFGEGSDISRTNTPANGTPKSRAGTPANGVKKTGGLFGKVGGRKMDDEVIGSMDMGIDDIEI